MGTKLTKRRLSKLKIRWTYVLWGDGYSIYISIYTRIIYMAIRVQSGRDVDDSARVYYNIVAKCHIIYNVDSFVGFIGIALYIVRVCVCIILYA